MALAVSEHVDELGVADRAAGDAADDVLECLAGILRCESTNELDRVPRREAKVVTCLLLATLAVCQYGL
jgi:hypothetical protein